MNNPRYWYRCEKHFDGQWWEFLTRPPYDAVCDICGKDAKHFGSRGWPKGNPPLNLDEATIDKN